MGEAWLAEMHVAVDHARQDMQPAAVDDLAGLRLGFALAAPARAMRIRDALGPWAVSGTTMIFLFAVPIISAFVGAVIGSSAIRSLCPGAKIWA